VLREQSPLQINTYVLTFVIDEVEVFTGSVKCFSRKMHKAPEKLFKIDQNLWTINLRL
jgi:hypothetical protein